MRRVGTTDISKFMTPYKYGLQPGFGSDDPAASSTPGALPNWFPTVGLPTVTVQPAPAPAPAPASDSTKTILYVGIAAAVLGGLYLYSRKPGSFVANGSDDTAKKSFWRWTKEHFDRPGVVTSLPPLYRDWKRDLREFSLDRPGQAAKVRDSVLKFGARMDANYRRSLRDMPSDSPFRAEVEREAKEHRVMVRSFARFLSGG